MVARIVHIGVVSGFAPNLIFSGYQPVFDYLNANSENQFELQLSTSYQNAVGLTAADLDSIHHFDHHQTVLWQVLRRHFDTGVAMELIAERYLRERLRRVALAPSIPGPPQLTRLLLANWTPEFAFGFLAVTKADYDEAFCAMEARQ